MKKWHTEARAMLSEGLSISEIAKHFDVSWPAAQYAVCDDARAKTRSRVDKRHAKLVKPCAAKCGRTITGLGASGHCQSCIMKKRHAEKAAA